MSKPSSLAARAGFVLAVIGFAAFAAPPASAHDARVAGWYGNTHVHATKGLSFYGNRGRRATKRLIADVRAGRVACYQRPSYRRLPFHLRRDIFGTRIGAHKLKRLLRKGYGTSTIECYRTF